MVTVSDLCMNDQCIVDQKPWQAGNEDKMQISKMISWVQGSTVIGFCALLVVFLSLNILSIVYIVSCPTDHAMPNVAI